MPCCDGTQFYKTQLRRIGKKKLFPTFLISVLKEPLLLWWNVLFVTTDDLPMIKQISYSPQVTDVVEGLQIWTVAANVLKRSELTLVNTVMSISIP